MLSRFAGAEAVLESPSLLKGFSFSQLPATKEKFIGALGAVIKERFVDIDGYKWAWLRGVDIEPTLKKVRCWCSILGIWVEELLDLPPNPMC